MAPGANHPHGDIDQHHDYHTTLDIATTIAPEHLGSISSMFG